MRSLPWPVVGLLALSLAVPPASAVPADPVLGAQLALEAGRLGEARTLLRPPARAGDIEALHWLGRVELEAGEVDEALDCFKQGVELQPELVRSHFWYGRACHAKVDQSAKLFQIKWAKRMRRAFERANELDPEDPEPLFALVRFHREAPGLVGGDRELAWTHVRVLARVDPALGEPVVARMSLEDGDPGAAADAYGRAVAASPEAAGLRYALAATLADAGRAEESFAALDAQLERSPGDPLALYLVGRTAAVTGQQLDRGRVALEAYLAAAPPEGGPPHPAAHWRLGSLSERAGDREAARASYRAALQLDPDFQPAQDGLAALPER